MCNPVIFQTKTPLTKLLRYSVRSAMKEALLTKKQYPTQRTTIRLSENLVVGGTNLVIIGGPCSVESFEQMNEVARRLAAAPVQMLRGGVFKPRSSPYSFQGLGED